MSFCTFVFFKVLGHSYPFSLSALPSSFSNEHGNNFRDPLTFPNWESPKAILILELPHSFLNASNKSYSNFYLPFFPWPASYIVVLFLRLLKTHKGIKSGSESGHQCEGIRA